MLDHGLAGLDLVADPLRSQRQPDPEGTGRCFQPEFPMKKMTKYLLVMIGLFVNHAIHANPSIDECKQLFDEARWESALAPCIRAAESGDSSSQTILAEVYDRKGDSGKTAFWLEKAASSNYQPARNLLALKYYYGGSVFGPEEGWQQDYAKAFDIWLGDSRNGIASSQFMVGLMYFKAEGVAYDPSEAYFWLKVSLAKGYKMSTDVLIEVSKRITPAQRQSAEEKLAKYYAKNGADQSAPSVGGHGHEF